MVEDGEDTSIQETRIKKIRNDKKDKKYLGKMVLLAGGDFLSTEFDQMSNSYNKK
jgi:hypothetical protein